MSREIKFRAWGKNSKEYLGSSSDGFNMEELSRLAGQFKDWELEQYTGLKDKNGKEIYEGDILETVDKAVRYIVVWDEDDLGYWGKAITCTPDFSMDTVDSDDEVIGNIHENPELLGGEG